ncbi:EF-hand domain-containing protein [Marinovum sp. 2_MG-2023]|uniref:EF-hand domain-containing protein n=1 Tax=Roseobacteraceae TaxID=2854170 RepID=UPI001FD551E2|nr:MULTISPECIES: EF-hand domain-containing protein [Roseobacteraceae]MCJ7874576.1 EF-hand domain-containing protein [Phaeobacter sp. J2-8]MDO6731943.1 EF-hand domain-containing protein [Marinovum sp. 2_MG-2023]MDO6781195.1 EF-hand domain-containing protein [Marinovum sp. 1_MG-2023]
MTSKAITFAALIGFAASSALAQTMVEDTDQSGGYSMEELVAAYPDLTVEGFAEIDVDQNGEVSADELTAAQAAGLLAE